MAEGEKDRRVMQIVAGSGFLVVLSLVVCGTLMGWGYLPGVLGEWVGTMIGLVTSPFLLEFSFGVLGLCLVFAFNHWYRKRDGEELVYLDCVDGPEVPTDLPDHAKWAIYRDKPLDGEVPSLLVRAEGALSIGDYEEAAAQVAAMDPKELREPGALAVRMELARAAGRMELVEEMQAEMKKCRGE